ncbi:MAG TPA: MTH1187 family thiamine-binding protein [Desulfotomaculum sp.]|nr:MTH1187 family thiamine-binding protein [Desulfotomaculum sp.]
MIVAEISVVPLGTGSPGLSRYIADCVKVLEESGLSYEVTAMGTIVEGEFDAVLAVVRQMHQVPFRAGVLRVVTTLKIDDRRDRPLSAKGKVETVARRLGK